MSETRGEYSHLTGPVVDRYDDPVLEAIRKELEARHVPSIDAFLPIIAQVLNVWRALMRKASEKNLRYVERLHLVHCIAVQLWEVGWEVRRHE